MVSPHPTRSPVLITMKAMADMSVTFDLIRTFIILLDGGVFAY